MAKDLTQRFGCCVLSCVCPGVDCIAAHGAAEKKVFAEEHRSELDSLERLVLRHLLQLRCNSLAVSQVVGELECDFSARVSTAGQVERCREVRIGTILPCTASFMNHSCSPNAMFR